MSSIPFVVLKCQYSVKDGDLSFKKGEIITVTQKSDRTDDWYVIYTFHSLTIIEEVPGGPAGLTIEKEYFLLTLSR